MSRLCIFCGASQGLEEEHTLAKWIARSVIGRRRVLKIHRFGSGQLSRRVAYQSFWVTTTQVCGRCNRWMGNIENRTKRVLEPLFHGQSRTLTPEDMEALTIWITKTLLVLEFTRGSERVGAHFSEEDRREFRRTGSPLPNSHIWLAAYSGAHLMGFGDRQLPVSIVEFGEDSETEIYVATCSIGQLAFQFLHIRWPTDWPSGRVALPRLETDDFWGDSTLLAWPAPSGVTWPPVRAFDNDAMQMFADRFRDPNETEPSP